MIVQAAAQALKAADFILGGQFNKVPATEQAVADFRQLPNLGARRSRRFSVNLQMSVEAG
jgi:hypothetical protein